VSEPTAGPTVVTVEEVESVARLLDAFNREFGTPTPGVTVLAQRLAGLLARNDVIALLGGNPPAGVALLTLRPNVWFDGPVAMLDELYVVPERRGRGLGSQLLAAAEEAAGELGAELIEINVDGEDTDARRFHERHGYANVDPGQAEPQLYYHRELGSGDQRPQ